MNVRTLALLPVLSLPCFAGLACAPTIDPENVEGISKSDDELFRYVDFPGVAADLAFTTLRDVVKLRFAGGGLVEDAERMTVETTPRPLTNSSLRVTLFGQVSAIEGGARIELFGRMEELRDDLSSHPTEPWQYVGADAKLENFLFQELWDRLMVKR